MRRDNDRSGECKKHERAYGGENMAGKTRWQQLEGTAPHIYWTVVATGRGRPCGEGEPASRLLELPACACPVSFGVDTERLLLASSEPSPLIVMCDSPAPSLDDDRSNASACSA